PTAIDSAASDRTSHYKHDVGVAVIGAAIAVLAGGASELRHRDHDGIFSEIAEIGPECSDRLRELAQHVGELALCAAFVDVVVPSADVGECNLHAQVGLDELSELLQAVSETSVRIIRARRGNVLGGIGRLQHLYRLERLLPRAMQ